LLTHATRVFTNRCILGIAADRQKCEANVEQSLAMCTALAPVIGYDKAARIAKTAYETGRTVREVAMETSGLDKSTLDKLLDPRAQTSPSE
jgi:fumarate hydratase, class II